jgi:hypothetical protein
LVIGKRHRKIRDPRVKDEWAHCWNRNRTITAIVIGLMYICLVFILYTRLKTVTHINACPEQNTLNVENIKKVDN